MALRPKSIRFPLASPNNGCARPQVDEGRAEQRGNVQAPQSEGDPSSGMRDPIPHIGAHSDPTHDFSAGGIMREGDGGASSLGPEDSRGGGALVKGLEAGQQREDFQVMGRVRVRGTVCARTMSPITEKTPRNPCHCDSWWSQASVKSRGP